MLSEVMEYYGFKKPLDHLGYFETEHHAQLVKELKIVIAKRAVSGSRWDSWLWQNYHLATVDDQFSSVERGHCCPFLDCR